MSDLQRVLIAGTGPASIQMAVMLQHYLGCGIGIAGRPSARSERVFAALRQSRGRIRADIQNEKHRPLAGECRVEHVFQGYEAAAGHWDTVLLAVTADAYTEVLGQLREELLRQIGCVVLLSPTFCSGALVRQWLSEKGVDAEVVSFSTYLGDTRWAQEHPSERVITAGVKRKVYIGSTRSPSSCIGKLRSVYERLGITLEDTGSPIEAETRNISLYVHPPLFMNDFSLNVIFGNAPASKYVYKLYPEGPITPDLIGTMLDLWKELSAIHYKLKISPVNLLKFMIDDNYPVRPESIPRRDIVRFDRLEPIHQAYLLYVRYASLLIDPFSEPDLDGKYFDFSAVPIQSIFIGKDGRWDVPRMPKEDYYRIKIIQGIARYVGSDCPAIDRFISDYERAIEAAALKLNNEPMTSAFAVQSFGNDIKHICNEIEMRLNNDSIRVD